MILVCEDYPLELAGSHQVIQTNVDRVPVMLLLKEEFGITWENCSVFPKFHDSHSVQILHSLLVLVLKQMRNFVVQSREEFGVFKILREIVVIGLTPI